MPACGPVRMSGRIRPSPNRNGIPAQGSRTRRSRGARRRTTWRSALVPAPIATLSYAALLANDAFVSLAPVFHFDLETAVFSLTFGLGHRLAFSSLAILLVTSVSSVAFLSARLSGVRERAVAQPGLLVLAALIIALDVLGGTSALSRSDTARVRINIATSALYKTVGAVRRGLFFSPTAGMSKKAPSVPSATGG